MSIVLPISNVFVQVVFSGEQPLFQQDIGAVSLFCENVRQVLAEIGRSVVRHSCKGTPGGALSLQFQILLKSQQTRA